MPPVVSTPSSFALDAARVEEQAAGGVECGVRLGAVGPDGLVRGDDIAPPDLGVLVAAPAAKWRRGRIRL